MKERLLVWLAVKLDANALDRERILKRPFWWWVSLLKWRVGRIVPRCQFCGKWFGCRLSSNHCWCAAGNLVFAVFHKNWSAAAGWLCAATTCLGWIGSASQ